MAHRREIAHFNERCSMMRKKISLSRETLRSLTDHELGAVNGARPPDFERFSRDRSFCLGCILTEYGHCNTDIACTGYCSNGCG